MKHELLPSIIGGAVVGLTIFLIVRGALMFMAFVGMFLDSVLIGG